MEKDLAVEIEKCSFCGRPKESTKKFYKGHEGNICSDCADVIKDDFDFDYEEVKESISKLKKPYEIVRELDEYIVGQDEAKKIIAVAAYNHYKRVNVKTQVEMDKANILIVGPTGSGKTHLMKTLGRILDVPVAIADATSLTEAGYIGEDVESVIVKLIKDAGMDIQKAEKGIVYIDEIDKISARDVEGRRSSRDVSGEGVQQALLKMLEGHEMDISLSNGSSIKSDKVKINTKNILFVCGGAFAGIEDIIKRRNTKKVSLGFAVKEEEEEKEEVVTVSQDDLMKYGMIPEFLGRLPVIVRLDKLEVSTLRKIMTEPKNALIKQYVEMFKIDGVDIKFEDDALDFIAEMASKKDMGARGLRGIIESYIYDLMYDVTEKSYEGELVISKKQLIDNMKS